jgi:hypothetical protein
MSTNILSPRSTTPSKPNPWYQEENVAGIVTPSVFDTTQPLFYNVPMYDHDVSQPMELDDSILNIQTVSTREQNCAST